MEAIERCQDCGNSQFKAENHELICKSCGLVIDDYGTEALPLNILSEIETRPVDGKIVKASWLLSSREKNLRNSSMEMDKLAWKLSLPGYVREQAFAIYKEAVNRDLCIGRRNESIRLAALYQACLENDWPKTAFEIIQGSNVSKRSLLRAHRILKRKLGLKIGLSDPLDYLPRFVSQLSLSQACLTKAMEIMEKVKESPEYSGKNPKSIVAGVIYLAAKECGEEITQRQVANLIGVTEVTIRKRCKEIHQ